MENNSTKNQMEISVQQLQKQGIVMPKNITDKVFNTLSVYQSQGSVNFPQNYSVGNALKSAWLIYQQDAKLQACDQNSVANALLDMCIGGLNPSKSQCYFVPMGNKCTLMTSYFGKQTMVKRIKGVKDVRADVIYRDTKYELIVDVFGNDDIKITEPCPLDKRKNENIIGAWARIILDQEIFGTDSFVTIMTLEDIQNAFNMGNAKGASKAHKSFLNEMAKKTAINRCIKNFVNTRDDQDIIIDVLNRTTNAEYKDDYADVQSKVVDVQASEIVEMPKEPKPDPNAEPKKEAEAVENVGW